jgi:hypothetical protein
VLSTRAVHLEPVENGPNWGLTLERGSDLYCSYDRWEKDIKVQEELKGHN